jgi:16S rRNA processing protein RimM
VAGVFGLRGELKVAPTRIGADALGAGVTLHATLRDGSARTLRVRAMRMHKERPLVQFEGVDDANAADALVGATLAIDRADVVLAEGEYLDDDLVGCVLVDSAGTTLAQVTGVEHYPAQDVLIVKLPGGGRGMVPMVGAFIRSIDVAARRIEVDLPIGLLDDREAEQA